MNQFAKRRNRALVAEGLQPISETSTEPQSPESEADKILDTIHGLAHGDTGRIFSQLIDQKIVELREEALSQEAADTAILEFLNQQLDRHPSLAVKLGRRSMKAAARADASVLYFPDLQQ